MNSIKVRNLYVLPELVRAEDMINRILICYRERQSVSEKAKAILYLMDVLKDELNNPLEEVEK